MIILLMGDVGNAFSAKAYFAAGSAGAPIKELAFHFCELEMTAEVLRQIRRPEHRAPVVSGPIQNVSLAQPPNKEINR